jgi:hypothetical protein
MKNPQGRVHRSLQWPSYAIRAPQAGQVVSAGTSVGAGRGRPGAASRISSPSSAMTRAS